jgi:hypothetical protein
VTLEAVAAGKLSVDRTPVEIVPADQKVTAWVGEWRSQHSGGKGLGSFEWAGPPRWVMRVGDRLPLTFYKTSRMKLETPPPVTIPAAAYVEPSEPFRTRRP